MLDLDAIRKRAEKARVNLEYPYGPWSRAETVTYLAADVLALLDALEEITKLMCSRPAGVSPEFTKLELGWDDKNNSSKGR